MASDLPKGDPNDVPEDGGAIISGESELPTIEERESDHRRQITLVLVGLLCLIVVSYVGAAIAFEWNGKEPKTLLAAFNAVLPVVSGLASSTVTYYFTRNDKR